MSQVEQNNPEDFVRDGDDPRVEGAMREFMAEMEAGKRPTRKEFLRRYPDIAEELSRCLAGLAFLDAAAAQIKEDAGVAEPTDDPVLRSALMQAEPLGDFRLVREIGRGGMGVVYEAQQMSLGRTVALKVLPMAAALDPRQLQRFHNEAQAAAQLHHTNIVPVYAVGCERSVHYYAMQLIEGKSIADVIQSMRGRGGESGTRRPATPSEKKEPPFSPSPRTRGGGRGEGSSSSFAPYPSSLNSSPHPEPLPEYGAREQDGRGENSRSERTSDSVAEISAMRSSRRGDYYRYVANLAVQAARALDYAHQMGIVHRDIKPANLLFDWRGTLWITDFGLAQIYSDAPHNMTMPGDVLGTLRYMSPEQASGSGAVLDGRTDVYSLGVTLYELLTLERAIGGDSRPEMLRRIAQVDPIAPRWFDKRIPVELETIVMKAIAKEPRDRYATAREMAEDLERFLRHEPIKARRPTAWEQTSKWVHRHWHLTLSVLIIFALATIALAVSNVYISREKSRTKEALDIASAKAWEASRAQVQAKENFEQARRAVEFMTQIAANEMPQDPRLAPVRRRLLETALSYDQNFFDREKQTHDAKDLASQQAKINQLLAQLTANDQWAEVNYELWLLGQSSVANELHLTTDQRVSIRGLNDSEDSGVFFDPSGDMPPEMRPPPDQRNIGPQDPRPLEKSLRGILTVRQMERLEQISRQLRGPAAFGDVEVASVLGLTAGQKSMVQTIRTQYEELHHGPGGGGPPGDMRREAMAKILQQLTPEQRKIWSGLIGETFKGYIPGREPRRQLPGPPPPMMPF